MERGGRCPIASLQARFDCPLNEINSITIKYFVLFMADLELGDCGEIRAESGRGGHKNSTLLCPCFTFQGLATFWKRQIRNGGIIIRGSRQIPHRIKPELFFGHHKKKSNKKNSASHICTSLKCKCRYLCSNMTRCYARYQGRNGESDFPVKWTRCYCLQRRCPISGQQTAFTLRRFVIIHNADEVQHLALFWAC